MAGRHQKTIWPNLSRAAGLGGATDRDVLANYRTRADTHAGWRAGIEAQVLRIAADYGEWMHDDGFTELTMPRDQRMGMDDAAGPESRAVFN